MNFESYTVACETTESFKRTLPDSVTFRDIIKLLEKIVETGEAASKMKRAIFYREDDNGDEVTSPKLMRLLHSVLGMQDEEGEFAQNLLNTFLSKLQEIDTVNWEEEMGDMAYYEAMSLSALDLKFADVLNKNLAKLNARYGGEFSVERALNRDREHEREVLQGKVT